MIRKPWSVLPVVWKSRLIVMSHLHMPLCWLLKMLLPVQRNWESLPFTSNSELWVVPEPNLLDQVRSILNLWSTANTASWGISASPVFHHVIIVDMIMNACSRDCDESWWWRNHNWTRPAVDPAMTRVSSKLFRCPTSSQSLGPCRYEDWQNRGLHSMPIRLHQKKGW